MKIKEVISKSLRNIKVRFCLSKTMWSRRPERGIARRLWVVEDLRLTGKALQPNMGQALIEVLIALTLAVLVLTSVTVVILSALTNAEHSKLQAEATQYAQEGIDNMRAMQILHPDTYDALPKGDHPYCMESFFEDSSSPGPGCDGKLDTTPGDSEMNATDYCRLAKDTGGSSWGKCNELPSNTYDRKIKINDGGLKCGSNNQQIDVTVSWSDSKCKSASDAYCNKVVLSSCFSNEIRSNGL